MGKRAEGGWTTFGEGGAFKDPFKPFPKSP